MGSCPRNSVAQAPAESVECGGKLVSPLSAPADRVAEGNVRPRAPESARLAVIVVAARDDAPVYLPNQPRGDRPACRLRAEPAVRPVGCPKLPLRTGQIGARRCAGREGLVLLALGELGSLDARGAHRLQAHLLLVGLLDPLRQVRQPVQHPGGGPGFDKRPGYRRAVVAQPLPGNVVSADGHVCLISGSFRVYRYEMIPDSLFRFQLISGPFPPMSLTWYLLGA